MKSHCYLFGALALFIIALPHAASAEGKGLSTAKVCLAAGDYACAQDALKKVESKLVSLSESERIRYWHLRTELEFSLKEGDATVPLRELLRHQPDWRPSAKAWPPSWLELLERVRASLPDTESPELVVEPILLVHAGQALIVKARLKDRSGVGRVMLTVGGREAESLHFVTADGETWSVEIPGSWIRGSTLSMWVEAYDRKGNGPARWGDAKVSKQFNIIQPTVVTVKSESPVWKSWWFWTAIGAGLTATALTTYYLTGVDESSPTPIYSTLEVNLTWPQFD